MSETALSPRRILGFFAHPDDELSAGGTFARYAAQGAHVTLLCATRGEAATIYSPPEYGATPENLGEVRARELACCVAELGVQELRWLDWPDGAVAALDREQAVSQVTAVIRQFRPHVLITHPVHGGYPHPDHIAVHEIALAAWYAAADPAYRPDLGPVHAVAKLYARVIPQSFFEKSSGFAEYRISLKGEQLAFSGTPDDEITTVLDVAQWAPRRAAGWECHKSQHNPSGFFSAASEEVQQAFASREFLLLLAHHLESEPLRETDLFAGLPDPKPRRTPAPMQAEDVEKLAARLMAGLRARQSYMTVYKEYLRRKPKPEMAELLQSLIDDNLDAVATLSTALRGLDRSPLKAGANEKLLAQGFGRKGVLSRLNYIIIGQQKSLTWYDEQLSYNDPPAIRAVWQDLSAVETVNLARTQTLLAEIETASGLERETD